MSQTAAAFRARLFAKDLAKMLKLSDERKAENAAARARAQANPGLCAVLLAAAKQRGQAGIDWPEYFRNSYMV